MICDIYCFINIETLSYKQKLMISPKKNLEVDKESTLFGDLSHIEKQTTRLSTQLVQDIQRLKKVQNQLQIIEKESKKSGQQFKIKAHKDIQIFEQRIKAFLVAQKSEYSRLATQINQIVSNHKEINSHLKLLQTRFIQYQKNVGI